MTIPTSVYLLYDERMTWHRPPGTSVYTEPVCNPELLDENGMPTVFENASRIVRLHQTAMDIEKRLTGHDIAPQNNNHYLYDEDVYQGGGIQPHFQSNCLWASNPAAPHNLRRFLPLEATPCPRSVIELAHTRAHYDAVLRTSRFTDEQLRAATDDDDIYYCRDTFYAAALACGGVVNCVDAVTESLYSPAGTPSRAIALVRPPGHHATHDKAQGFCYFNNIAVAAKHAVASGRAERVFILDWDIHHGNGIQDITYDDTSIFYLSLHRGCFGPRNKEWFYPGTGRHSEVGRGSGSGRNLNIPWGCGGMGDTHYAAAFSEAVLPVLSSFNPDLIIVACGFDAVRGDLLGDCGLSPHMYYIMTRSLLDTCGADVPLVMALEGGYNLDVISKCFTATALALLDEPLCEDLRPPEDVAAPSSSVTASTEMMDYEYEPRPKLQKKLKNKMFLDDQQLTLQRYWRHEHLAFFQDSKQHQQQDKTTSSALSAIKKSIRALVRKGGFRGRLPMAQEAPSENAPPFPPIKQIVPMCNRPVQGRYVPDEEMLVDDVHRPEGESHFLPLKKRKLRRSTSFDGDLFGSERQYYSNADVELLMSCSLRC